MGRLLQLAVLIVVIDQITKFAVEYGLSYGQRIAVFPFFDITLLYNRGAAFSFLAQGSGWQRWLLIGVALGAIVFILWLLKTQHDASRQMRLALTLILAGAAGNLIDRIAYGHVVDFILLYWHPWYYPAFNIADTTITCGAILLVLDEIRRWRTTRRNRNT